MMKVYLVGGAVRDELLGLSIGDRDWVVVGSDAAELSALGYQQVGKDFPVFLHPETGEEYALARLERKIGPGHQGFEFDTNKAVTLSEDLSRRDLTINAIAKDQDGQFIDPLGGRQDCQDRILRHISPAFAEDPLRCLRVARFAAQLDGFTVHQETMTLMQQMVKQGDLGTLSKPRIWQEWHKALITGRFGDFVAVLMAMGAFEFWQITLSDALLELPFTALDTTGQFALLLGHLTQVDMEQLLGILAPPKEYQDLAKLVSGSHDFCRSWGGIWQADHFMELFGFTDAFRRPERLTAWLAVAEVDPALSMCRQSLSLVDEVLTVAKTKTAQEVVAMGHQGPEVGQVLSAHRLNEINGFLQKTYRKS